MSNLNAKKNANDDMKNFELLAKYIRCQRLLQSDDAKLISEIDNISSLGIGESNKSLDQDNIIPKNDYLESYSEPIKNKINEVEKLNLSELEKDKFLKGFIQTEFLGALDVKLLSAEIFYSIKNIKYQFALIEYALKNGINPMDLFNIDIDWMVNRLKAKKFKTVNLNGRKMQLQNKKNEKGLFCPEFYLKCELVFNLLCLYDGKNLFDLFSAEKIIRLFESCSKDVFLFCCEKIATINKNTTEKNFSLSSQLEKEFKAIGKRYGRIGGLFGFLFSLILIAIIANVLTVSSLSIFLIVPLGILVGWAIGKVKVLGKHNKILNLLSQTNKENNVLLMRQTFEAFKKEYESSKQNPPFGTEKFNNGNTEKNPQMGTNNKTEKLDDSIYLNL